MSRPTFSTNSWPPKMLTVIRSVATLHAVGNGIISDSLWLAEASQIRGATGAGRKRPRAFVAYGF